MSYIKLKELSVSGKNVVTSSIVFGEKLTIIAGPSDTGKSYIFKCIDYILGARNDDEHRPLDIQDNYDTIELVISTYNGDVKFTRKIDSAVTLVESAREDIKSGEYVYKENKSNRNTMNDLILKLVNIPPNIKLPKNNKGGSASLTWRTIKNAFLIDEQNADKSDSIFFSSFNQTLFFASLIYLINNDELSEYRKDGEPELLRKAKKNAVIDYIKKQRMLLESKIGSFEDEIKKHTNEKTLQEQVQDLNNQLNETNEKIDSANQSNKNISNALLPVQKRLSRSKATMARYKELKSQYDTDINRLTFIVENELISSNRTPRTKCPFCESHMVPHDHTSYIEASQAELVKLINNLNDLENTRIELKDQIDDDEALIKDYDEQLQEINKTLKESLIPQRNQITNLLSNYTERIQIEGALVQFKEFSLRFEDDIKEYEQEKSSHFTPFDGKKVLFELVSNGIENNAKQILSEIGYTPLESVGFDLSSFDLIVNNRMKNTHGKGYKAFFNSVLTLALLQYLCEHSTKNPGFYIFDSPLKGLTLSEEVINNKNIRVGYFEYLLNLNSESQIVIMENTNDRELPLIASNEKVKVYEFTQVEGKGRYGFLNSVRRK